MNDEVTTIALITGVLLGFFLRILSGALAGIHARASHRRRKIDALDVRVLKQDVADLRDGNRATSLHLGEVHALIRAVRDDVEKIRRRSRGPPPTRKGLRTR